MPHFLTISDLCADELRHVVALAGRADLPAVLERRGVALIFEKPSNRTRQSMEVAVVQLGGHPVYTRGDEVGFDVREPVEDIARVMSGYHAVIAARVFEHSVIERLAASSTVPVINMLSDWAHPLQAIADVQTMIEAHGDLAGRQIAYVGDYNNVARSLTEASLLLGAQVAIASPPGFGADGIELERLAGIGSGAVSQTSRPDEAVAGATAVHTDTWVSMGQEREKEERRRAFEGFQVDATLMRAARPGATFYHCMPAYRGFEVSAEVFDGPASRAIRQAHHRLDAARGALAFALGVH